MGWPALDDRNISRFTPSFPTPCNDCISLYGDSFVYGYEVNDEQAWGNVVSENIGCRVGNFGVGGYGTDQSYLRFTHNIKDQSPITILGVYPENVLRNVNQYRFVLTGVEIYSFKPRFILNDGKLKLIPIPTIDYDDLKFFYQTPEKYLKYESFLPDSEYGPVSFSFPHSVTLIRLVLKERVTNWLLNKPSWEAYWQPGHPTQAMEITSAIISEFHKDCSKRHKLCLVIVFPTPLSYEWFLRTNSSISQFLIAELSHKGITTLDLTEEISKKLQNESFCTILTRPQSCEGHFNAKGNRLVAEIVIDYLLSAKWITTQSK